MEHCRIERARAKREIREFLDAEVRQTRVILVSYRLKADESATLVEALCKHPQSSVDLMMRFKFDSEKPQPSRERNSSPTLPGA